MSERLSHGRAHSVRSSLPYSDYGKQYSSLPLFRTQLPLLLKSNAGFKCLVRHTFFFFRHARTNGHSDKPDESGHCEEAKWWLWKSCNLIGQFPGLWPCRGVRFWELRQAAEIVCSPNLLQYEQGILPPCSMRTKRDRIHESYSIGRGVQTHPCHSRYRTIAPRLNYQIKNYWHPSRVLLKLST